MPQEAKDDSAPQLPALVLAARALFGELQTLSVPPGIIEQRILDELPVKGGSPVESGLKPVLKALAQYIAQLPTENEPLIRRLRGEDGVNIVGILGDITINPPDLNVQKQELRDALTLEGKSIFELIKVAIATTGTKKGPPKPEDDSAVPPPPPEDDGKPKLRGKHGWRNTLGPEGSPPNIDREIKKEAEVWDESHGDSKKKIRQIHEEAAEYDKNHGALPDEVIKKKAGRYDKHHHYDESAIRHSADRGLTGDAEYEEDRPKGPEIAAYTKLADDLAAQFDKALGTHLKTGVGGHEH